MMSPYVLPGVKESLSAKFNSDQVEAVKIIVARYYNEPVINLSLRTRKRTACLPRQICMAILKDISGLALKTIGMHFGGRDHSTVIHARQVVDDLLSYDKNFQRDYMIIRRRVNEYRQTGIVKY